MLNLLQPKPKVNVRFYILTLILASLMLGFASRVESKHGTQDQRLQLATQSHVKRNR